MGKKGKTNVMRLLEQRKIAYRSYQWEDVKKLDIQAPVYKTLVTVGKTGNHYVFLVPTDAELNLKKAAQAVSEKNIQMIKEKDLLPLTGYLHGGCSPIGMKKEFETVFDQSSQAYSTLLFSAGKRGISVEVDPQEIKKIINYKIADIATS